VGVNDFRFDGVWRLFESGVGCTGDSNALFNGFLVIAGDSVLGLNGFRFGVLLFFGVASKDDCFFGGFPRPTPDSTLKPVKLFSSIVARRNGDVVSRREILYYVESKGHSRRADLFRGRT